MAHDLPTAYDPHLKKLAIGAERFPEEWESYSIEGDLWSRVEERLGYPDMDQVMGYLEHYAPDLLSDRESDRNGIIHEAESLLTFPLKEFAQNADDQLASASPLLKFRNLFHPHDYFLTFNYTHTLERLYGIDSRRILHLHGEVGVSRLIIGYAPGSLRGTELLSYWDDEENYDFYRSRAYEAVARRLASFEKTYQHEALTAYIGRLPGPTSRVMIFGHSLGAVDKPYFDDLAREFSDVPWTVLAYSDSALEEACRALDSFHLGIDFDCAVF